MKWIGNGNRGSEMFRKSRIRIVALLMAILLLTLLGTIAVIYGVSYREMSQENREMLELYSSEYLENGGLPDGDGDGDELPPKTVDDDELLPEDEEGLLLESEPSTGDSVSGKRYLIRIGDDDEYGRLRRLDLSTFYSVVFDADGSVLTVNNDDPSQLSDEALTDLARAFLDSGKSYGISHNMIYLVSGEDYTLVSMMDNTLVGESIVTLLRYTVIFGAVAILVVLILAILLSGWIIRPLEENYERQNQFISDAGHELKTPVSTISTNAELLRREIGENRWLENIRYENDRMTEIVRSLLDLLRAENAASQAQGVHNSHAAQMERLDLGRAVTAGVLPFEGKAFEEGLELTCETADDIWIIGDAPQIGKLISILVDNAFAHTKPSGRIMVSLTGVKGTAVLKVANEGEPIPPESMDKLFDRFYRVDSSRTVQNQNLEAQPHYGLGLSIAKAIATAHRAKISVNCGDGVTTFAVEFPMKNH
ncbi:MAG: HAMP domain-containing histidine kinase [Clostridiales bacterium]|nr:HAMP domain-containing histidine kinase [Clostridiales bacterium]